MGGNFISVREASERYGYSGSHIRQLLLANKIEGRKFANAWMVNAESLQNYRAQMERLGKRKHGMWANNTKKNSSPSSDGRG